LNIDIRQAEIGVEQQDVAAKPGQRMRERDGEPGLPNTALA
jgi:hypothetical protein